MRAVVQIRGDVNMQSDVEDTLSMLNLHRVNHCALVPEGDTFDGMVAKVNDYVAFGEPDLDTLVTLIEKRGEPAEGDADVDDDYVAENTEYDGVEALAEALLDEETTLREEGLSPVLRLHPPRGGHDGLKHPASKGGQLGKHTSEEINRLLTSMR